MSKRDGVRERHGRRWEEGGGKGGEEQRGSLTGEELNTFFTHGNGSVQSHEITRPVPPADSVDESRPILP